MTTVRHLHGRRGYVPTEVVIYEHMCIYSYMPAVSGAAHLAGVDGRERRPALAAPPGGAHGSATRPRRPIRLDMTPGRYYQSIWKG